MFDLLLYGGGALAAIAMLSGLYYAIRKSGADAIKARNADAYQKSLDEIARAGNAKPVSGMSDDPYNRDR